MRRALAGGSLSSWEENGTLERCLAAHFRTGSGCEDARLEFWNTRGSWREDRRGRADKHRRPKGLLGQITIVVVDERR